MIWLEKKYAQLIGARLDRFHTKSNEPYLANFRCPLCGDSKKNKFKSRGFFYQREGSIYFTCHNCGAGMHLGTLIKQLNSSLYDEMVLEKMLEKEASMYDELVVKRSIKKIASKPFSLKDFPGTPLRDLTDSHTSWRLIKSRKIDEKKARNWFHTENFCASVNELLPKKFSKKAIEKNIPRLVIPYYYKGNLIGLIGRSYVSGDDRKYMTISLDKSIPCVYGLDMVDWNKDVLVLEGPIDASFLDNAIAASGSDISGTVIKLRNCIPEAREANFVIVHDNERKSPEAKKHLRSSVDSGNLVCFWPPWIQEKDINDMVLSGMTPERIHSLILESSKNGLEAKVGAITI